MTASADFEGRSSSKMVGNQVGEYLRFLVTYDEKGEDYIERFVVSSSLSAGQPAFEVVEQCRL